jgi:hypothetical protein
MNQIHKTAVKTPEHTIAPNQTSQRITGAPAWLEFVEGKQWIDTVLMPNVGTSPTELVAASKTRAIDRNQWKMVERENGRGRRRR